MDVLPCSTVGRWALGLLLAALVGSGAQYLLVWSQAGNDSSIAVIVSGLISTVAVIGTLVCGVVALLRRRDFSVLVIAAVLLALLGLFLPSG